MTNRPTDGSLSITVNAKEICKKLGRVQSGEKVELNGNEYTFLVDLNLLSSESYACFIRPLEMLEEGIYHAHVNSSYGAGWFWGEEKWKREIEEAKLTRASYLLANKSYQIESGDITPLGVSAIKKCKEIEALGENPLRVLKLLSILRDVGTENFCNDWFGLKDAGNLRAMIALVSSLVASQKKRELICAAIQDLSKIPSLKENKGAESELSLYLLSKCYEDEFNLEIAINPFKASILSFIRDLAIQQERGKFIEDRMYSGENFKLSISDHSRCQVKILSNYQAAKELWVLTLAQRSVVGEKI